jgi:hypothetical protein
MVLSPGFWLGDAVFDIVYQTMRNGARLPRGGEAEQKDIVFSRSPRRFDEGLRAGVNFLYLGSFFTFPQRGQQG